MSSLLVVGSVARDTIHNHLGSHPYILGGSAVFASLAASHFAPPRVVAVVGTDFPDDAIALLRGKGVDLTGLEVVEGRTFHWEGRYSHDLTSRESIKTELNVFADFHPKIPDGFKSTPYLMLGNIHPSLQVEVLSQMHKPSLVIADTMNFWIEGTPAELAQMLARIDLLVINEEEGRLLSGARNVAQVARKLHAMGPRIVVIKRGEYGALLFDEHGVFSAPAYPVEDVADPTGAGDTFAGGMLGFIAREDSTAPQVLRRAIIYGSALASFCVEGIGVTRLANVGAEELHKRYMDFARLAHFATDSELRAIGQG